jgi:hypothetical protein
MEAAPEWPTPPEAAVTMTFNLGQGVQGGAHRLERAR